MKNIFSIITTTIILSLFLKPASFAKDREYKFSFNGYVSEEIANQDDYALMEAAKYTLKKKYDYFVIKNARRYDRAKKTRSGGRFASNRPTKPRLKTELINTLLRCRSRQRRGS
ncbi:hypothetical protein N8742_08020 [Emcibacteraceae bacterium]|nr:hypothetical protein [Emcibacteraceae bacterium]